MDLTDKQRKILGIIQRGIETHGYPPTVREIGAEAGLCSPASVHNHLAALEAKGYIRRGVAKRRALELLRPLPCSFARSTEERALGSRLSRLPLVGRVAAGLPLLAEENIEDAIDVPRFLGGGEECFALRVTGSSMVKAGIFDGDIVVVRRQEHADDGDIVVALVGEEATIKRFFLEKEHVRLQPENDAMPPILIKEPRIVGRVTGVLRRL